MTVATCWRHLFLWAFSLQGSIVWICRDYTMHGKVSCDVSYFWGSYLHVVLSDSTEHEIRSRSSNIGLSHLHCRHLILEDAPIVGIGRLSAVY